VFANATEPAALGHISTGEFGYCDETGDPIGIERLMKGPTTVLTTEAQQCQENRTRRFRA
jgi:DnaK suppressor protein